MANLIIKINSDYYSNEEKFIFVAVKMELFEIYEVFRAFSGDRIINILIIRNWNGMMEVFSYNPFFTTKLDSFYSIKESLTNISHVFPDKLIDMNGFTYRVMFYNEPPRLEEINGIAFGPDITFMLIAAKKQNARIVGR